jgi:3-methyladenine DNA glycosylase AlkD
MENQQILKQLNSLSNPKNVEGMARFGINPKTKVLGISLPVLRTIAKDIKRSMGDPKELHKLALNLWLSGTHEARLIAVFIEDPQNVTNEQMEAWTADFDSWDICDQATTGLFDLTPLAYEKAIEWSKRKEEFQKRAGFSLMAGLAVHDKKAKDEQFYPFFDAIKEAADDERNYVRKAVNWALRNIGKFRNQNLYKLALETANSLKKMDSKSAKWIATDALRELNNEKIITRLKKLNLPK